MGIAVNLDCKGWWNLQAQSSLFQSVTKHFTVSGETYIGTHRTVPVSFVTNCKSYATNCKSDNSICKFCHPLQLVTVPGTAILLTSQGCLKWNPVCPGGDWKQKFLILYALGAYWVGGDDWKRFTRTRSRSGIGNNQVFPKIDHSAISDRIVLVEYTIGSVVELKFC